MTELSPAAQAFLEAAYALPLSNGQPDLSAALEALADQVVPEEKVSDFVPGAPQAYALQRRITRREILAIAAELRGESTTTPAEQEGADA